MSRSLPAKAAAVEQPGAAAQGAVAPGVAVPAGLPSLLRAGAGAGVTPAAVRRAAAPLADMLALAVAATAAGALGWPALGYAAAVLCVLAASGLYRPRICLRVFDQAGRITVAAAVPALLVMAWLPPGEAARLAAWSAGLMIAFRAASFAGLRTAHRHGHLMEPAVVAGTGETGQQVAGLLAGHPEYGLRPVGLVGGRPAGGPGLPVSGLPVLGSAGDLGQVIARHGIRRVIACPAAAQDADLVPALRAARRPGLDVCVVPPLHEAGTTLPAACRDEVSGIPLTPLRGQGRAGKLAKRAFDVAASLLLLCLLAPVIIALGLAMRLQLRRPALFRQVRVVGNGRLAEIVKLRTLAGHSDPDTCWVAPLRRSTTLGRLLRATHLDELPQLINVLRGDMSLVGPRPERPHFARRFAREIPGYAARQRVPAGLTGWAQVHGLNGDTSIADRARFDNYYIENWSFWLDLVILARTALTAAGGALGSRPRPGRSAAGRRPAGASQPGPVTSGSPHRGGQQ